MLNQVASPEYVIDGNNIALMGVNGKNKVGAADLRKVLALSCELAFNEYAFKCYFDDSMRRYVVPDQHDFLDLLLSCHGREFKVVPAGREADDYALEWANSKNAVIITHDSFRNKPHYRERYKWLNDAGRHIRPLFEHDRVNVPGLGVLDYQESTVAEFYDALLPFMKW